MKKYIIQLLILHIITIAIVLSISSISIAQTPSSAPEGDPKAENDRTYFENGLSLYKMKSYDKALLLFSEYIELFQEGAYRKDALRYMGDIYLGRFDYQKAVKYYQYLYEEFSSEEEGVGGYFQMGICHSRMGNTQKAVDIFKTIIEQHPSSRYVQKARTQLDLEELIKK